MHCTGKLPVIQQLSQDPGLGLPPEVLQTKHLARPSAATTEDRILENQPEL